MLEKLYAMLNAGEVFGEILPHRLGGNFFWDVLSINQITGNIRWRHYGSSANKNTIGQLAWILRVIFELTPEEFMAKYTTYAEYKKGARV